MQITGIWFEEYRDKGHWSHGELYLPLEHALAFVEDCRKHQLAVIGIDFFHLTKNDRLTPIWPIHDFDASDSFDNHETWMEEVNQCDQAATCVLREELSRDPTQYCNFTILEEHEWEAVGRN